MLRRRGCWRRWRQKQSRGARIIVRRALPSGDQPSSYTYSLPRSLRFLRWAGTIFQGARSRRRVWGRRLVVTGVGGGACIGGGGGGDGSRGARDNLCGRSLTWRGFLLGTPRTVGGEPAGWYRSFDFCVERSKRSARRRGRAAQGREDRRNDRSADLSYYRTRHLYK
jgi:hypothetical protein